MNYQSYSSEKTHIDICGNKLFEICKSFDHSIVNGKITEDKCMGTVTTNEGGLGSSFG